MSKTRLDIEIERQFEALKEPRIVMPRAWKPADDHPWRRRIRAATEAARRRKESPR
jgi:hypothetical protein